MKLPWITRLPWRKATLERAVWLADDTLLTVGWCLAPPGDLTATLKTGGTSINLDAKWIAFPRPDVDAPGGAGRLAIIRFPSPLHRHRTGTLTVGTAAAAWSVTMHALQSFTDPVATVVGEGAGWLDRHTRAEILAFLCECLGGSAESFRPLSKSMAAVRDVLREPLPEQTGIDSPSCACGLDRVIRIDERSFYLKGWAYPIDKAARLTAVSPEGHRVDLLAPAYRYRRPDLAGWEQAAAGFVAYVSLRTPSGVRDGWIAEIVTNDGAGAESAPCAASAPTAAIAREMLLSDMDLDASVTGRLLQQHIAPAIARLQEVDAAAHVVDEMVQFGDAVHAPTVSIVVPLYKRIDLVEHQIAQFALDPAMRDVEIIYVLDSPELAPALLDASRDLHELYRLSFRVLILTRNVGFAGANNAAASFAAGRVLVLLNSDVFPAAPGWVDRMLLFYERTPRIGALGVKLLYEDGTLQHAGLYFRRDTDTGVWENQHYFKGLERSFAAANVARIVPGVTGACLMIARRLYLDLGGLRGTYLQGDYEDSDLCLRLMAAGHDNWYFPDVELYHLEGQSYGWTWRSRVSRYNAWTHTQQWDGVIRSTMARLNA